MKTVKRICAAALCAGLCCVIAGGGLFYARRRAEHEEKKIKTLPTYRLSAFTEIQNRDALTLCAGKGLAAKTPENTVAAIRAAGEAGYRYILLDVAVTRDEVPVLLADDTLSRMTADVRPVRAVEYAALRGIPIDNGAGLDKLDAPVRIPSLAEALDVCAQYGMTPVLTIRTMRGIAGVQSVLRASGRPYTVASGSKAVLDAFREADCGRLYQTGALSSRAVRYAQKTGCGLLFDASQTKPEQALAAQDVPLWAQTVRSRTQLRALAEQGVYNVVTDNILPLRE